ncbi:HGxxPAAW family protein [Devriesea agamarum]|uniref:HGxxPAAW family protein n=1 Tax=Devriesea agamarum TaxID=472569 RepID=UPI00071C3BA1|nr:HGxxPAAW family protein [Devriesea agamarum]
MTKTYIVPPAPPANHGKTVAAWVMFVGIAAGAIVVAVGIASAQHVVSLVGVIVLAVTLLLSFVLRLAGFGQKRRQAA